VIISISKKKNDTWLNWNCGEETVTLDYYVF